MLVMTCSCRNYGSRGDKWIPGSIVAAGTRNYEVDIGADTNCKHHVEQLQSRVNVSAAEESIQQHTQRGPWNVMEEPVESSKLQTDNTAGTEGSLVRDSPGRTAPTEVRYPIRERKQTRFFVGEKV